MNSSQVDVAILGAGPAGLAVALALNNRGQTKFIHAYRRKTWSVPNFAQRRTRTPDGYPTKQWRFVPLAGQPGKENWTIGEIRVT